MARESLLNWYFGRPSKVSADLFQCGRPSISYDVEDTVSSRFCYSYGLTGHVFFSRISSPEREILRVIGSLGSLEISGRHLRCWDRGGALMEEIRLDDLDKVNNYRKLPLFKFVETLRHPETSVSILDDQVVNQEIINACYRGAKNGL